MNLEELFDLIDAVTDDADLTCEEIPSIELYLDQIITLINEKFTRDNNAARCERPLTKTMINNYSKDGLIMPVKGKKYSRELIIQMLTVYSLKNTLSMSEIKRLLSGFYSAEGYDGVQLADCYARFLKIKESERELTRRAVGDIFVGGGLDPTDGNDYFVGLLGIAAMSSYMKNIALAMLNEKYPELDEKLKDKDKDKK